MKTRICFWLLLVRLVLGGAHAQEAPRVVLDLPFDRPEALADWSPNREVLALRIADGAAQFRCQGSDPILEYRPRLNVPASSHQAIEIRMKADRDGVFEIFWSGTSEGRFGGFAEEKRTAFAVRGDGQWHTYRLFPFWQKERRLVRLRLDPYDGAQFALANMRVIELRPATPTAAPVFRFYGSAAGWIAAQETTLHTAKNALALALTAPDGFALSPPLAPAPASRLPYVSVRLASHASHATLLFATDASYGAHSLSFPLLADGKPHTYNLDMLDTPGWQGNIVAVGLRPGQRRGDTCRIASLRLCARPLGRPEVRVAWFGVEEALPRAGLPVTIKARLTNAGGEPVRGLRVSLTLPKGTRLLGTSERAPGELRFGQEVVAAWRVVFPQPVSASLSLRATGVHIGTVLAKTVERITPRQKVTAAYVPAPQPVKGRYPVGVYYFPGWKSASQWAPITRFPERRPLLGWYREGETEVIDWQIKWAVEHGITFFAYDWYWTQGARQLEHGLEAYLRSRYRKALRFCLLWANHNPPNTSSRDDLRAVTRHWIQTYFRQPEYLQWEGKPIVIIFSPQRFREDMGSAAVREAFEAMRAMCRAEGWKGLYLIACVGSTGELSQVAQEGYDAVTAYNWAGLGVQGSEKRAPYATLIEGYRRQWEQLTEAGSLPLLPPVSGGWDSRPWHGESALARTGRTPYLFRQHLQDTVRFLETHPQRTLPMALIEAWNEWGEGSYIEPHREFEFDYLDAIREVFAPDANAHRDLTPADSGRTPPQVEVLPPTEARWRFRNGLQGWESGMNITAATIAQGALTVRTTGDDPAFFGPPVQIVAEHFRTLHVRLRLEGADGVPFDDTAQLFWGTRTAAISEAASVRLPIRADGKWHDYTVPLAANPRWRGIVTNLRFDPGSRTGVLVQCEHLELRP